MHFEMTGDVNWPMPPSAVPSEVFLDFDPVLYMPEEQETAATSGPQAPSQSYLSRWRRRQRGEADRKD